MGYSQQNVDATYSTKKCPECYTYVPLRTDQCPSCKSRLGGVEKHGMAKRPTDWKSYIVAFIAWLTLGVYIWWAFF